MKHLDLFSGIGGFALAAMTVWGKDYECVGFCDIEPYAQQLLKIRFPGVKIYEDIKKLTAERIITDSDNRGQAVKEQQATGDKQRCRVDLLTGGFPCQPFSAAGKRKGTDDNRHLWPEMLRVITEIKPTWIIGENVAGILNMAQSGGDTDVENETDNEGSDNGESGADGIIWGIVNSLESIGYSVQTFVIPACAVSAPHRRDRVWIVGHATGERYTENGSVRQGQTADPERTDRADKSGIVAYSGHGNGTGQEDSGEHEKENRQETTAELKRPTQCNKSGITAHTNGSGPTGERTQIREAESIQGVNRPPLCAGRITGTSANGGQGIDIHSERQGLTRCGRKGAGQPGQFSGTWSNERAVWTENWLEVATEFCGVSYGLSNWLDGHYEKMIGDEFYGKTTQTDRIKNVSILREEIQKGEVWEKLGRLFEMEDKEILLSFMCRVETEPDRQKYIPHKGEETQVKGVLSLWKNAQFRRSPYRQEHQKQFAEQFNNIVPRLSSAFTQDIAEVWDYFQCGYSSEISPAVNLDGFKLSKAGHRVARLKGLGNSIVSQVAIEIMRAIKFVDNV